MTTFQKKSVCGMIGIVMLICLCLGLLFFTPSAAVDKLGISLEPPFLENYRFVSNITQLKPLYDTAGKSNVINGSGKTLKKGYETTNKPLIEVKGDLTINDLIIDGNCGVELSRTGKWTATNMTGNQPLIRVTNGATLTLNSCSITNNYSLYSGGGIVVEEGGTLNLNGTTIEYCMSEVNGGAIFNKGTVRVISGIIQYNWAGSSGGGVYCFNEDPGANSMQLLIKPVSVSTKDPALVVIRGNHAVDNGGGIYVSGNASHGTATIAALTQKLAAPVSVTISNNVAEYRGGGIYTDGLDLTVDGNVTISNNTAPSGAGVYGDTFEIGTDAQETKKVQITDNTATNYGGGVYVTDYAVLDRVTFSGNKATRGGGVYAITTDLNSFQFDGVELTDHTLIKENTATSKGGGIYAASAGVHLAGFPCIKDNTGGSVADNVHLAVSGGLLGSRIVLETSELTLTDSSGEQAVPIGLSSSVLSSGSSYRGYLTHNWNESLDDADFFMSESVRFAIGKQLLNGELVGYYCGKITYSPGEGEGENFVEYYLPEENFYTVTYPGFTRVGYTQIGWTVDNATIIGMNGGRFNAYGGHDRTLTPRWEANKYGMHLYYGDGTDDAYRVTYGTVVNLPSKYKTGYTLAGWSFDRNATEPDFVSTITYLYTENIVLYAVWELDGTMLTLDGNGGTDGTAGIPYEQNTFGEFDTLILPTREGYTFCGYTLTKDGTDYLINASGQLILNVADYTTNNRWQYTGKALTLYAKWEVEEYTVSFVTDSNESSYNPTTLRYGDPVNLPTPTKTGYKFLGWYTEDGMKIDGAIPDLGDNTARIYLYAHWEEIPVVEGDMNGDGEVDISDVTVLLDALASGETAGYDFNEDGDVDISDVTALLDLLTNL